MYSMASVEAFSMNDDGALEAKYHISIRSTSFHKLDRWDYGILRAEPPCVSPLWHSGGSHRDDPALLMQLPHPHLTNQSRHRFQAKATSAIDVFPHIALPFAFGSTVPVALNAPCRNTH